MKRSIKLNNCGFSLIELLAVFAIIFILSAIATVNLLAAKLSANEAAAVAQLKTFLIANQTYYTLHDSFAIPQQLYAAGFVGEEYGRPETLSCGKTIFTKSGYCFTMVPTKLERRITKQASNYFPNNNNNYLLASFTENSSLPNKNAFAGNTPTPTPTPPNPPNPTPTPTPNPGGSGGSGGNGNGNNEEIVILEFLMDAIPASDYKPKVLKTGFRWFYIDSLSNQIWIIKNPQKQNPCSPGEYCYDLQKFRPQYDQCLPFN